MLCSTWRTLSRCHLYRLVRRVVVCAAVHRLLYAARFGLLRRRVCLRSSCREHTQMPLRSQPKRLSRRNAPVSPADPRAAILLRHCTAAGAQSLRRRFRANLHRAAVHTRCVHKQTGAPPVQRFRCAQALAPALRSTPCRSPPQQWQQPQPSRGTLSFSRTGLCQAAKACEVFLRCSEADSATGAATGFPPKSNP